MPDRGRHLQNPAPRGPPPRCLAPRNPLPRNPAPRNRSRSPRRHDHHNDEVRERHRRENSTERQFNNRARDNQQDRYYDNAPPLHPFDDRRNRRNAPLQDTEDGARRLFPEGRGRENLEFRRPTPQGPNQHAPGPFNYPNNLPHGRPLRGGDTYIPNHGGHRGAPIPRANDHTQNDGGPPVQGNTGPADGLPARRNPQLARPITTLRDYGHLEAGEMIFFPDEDPTHPDKGDRPVIHIFTDIVDPLKSLIAYFVDLGTGSYTGKPRDISREYDSCLVQYVVDMAVADPDQKCFDIEKCDPRASNWGLDPTTFAYCNVLKPRDLRRATRRTGYRVTDLGLLQILSSMRHLDNILLALKEDVAERVRVQLQDVTLTGVTTIMKQLAKQALKERDVLARVKAAIAAEDEKTTDEHDGDILGQDDDEGLQVDPTDAKPPDAVTPAVAHARLGGSNSADDEENQTGLGANRRNGTEGQRPIEGSGLRTKPTDPLPLVSIAAPARTSANIVAPLFGADIILGVNLPAMGRIRLPRRADEETTGRYLHKSQIVAYNRERGDSSRSEIGLRR